MNTFMNDDFLLPSTTARSLYESVRGLPIIDYHCHLNPADIAADKRFANIAELWLSGDHYKWRLMRANGIDERYITGDADDYEKFEKWCETIEDAIGNPLYHWSHLELRRFFGYDGPLDSKHARDVWEHCNEVIQRKDFSVLNILDKFDVRAICTTDDPADDLIYHIKLREMIENGLTSCRVLPTFRPSKAMNINESGFPDYIGTLSEAAGMDISDYSGVRDALCSRMDFFHINGCRLSDNALDPPVYNNEYDSAMLDGVFDKAVKRQPLTAAEVSAYKTALFIDLGQKYAALGWTMQLHMGAMRNNNTAMYKILGADTGYDSMSDAPYAYALSRLMDSLADINALPKTILYNLNPVSNDMLATMTGNFQGQGIRGKIQFGSGWWFCDTLEGMKNQMTSLAQNGMLARFVGMLTDSRSFLSYTRHEYFRRVLCDLLAGWVDRGEFPEDMDRLTRIARDISYFNAKNYFGMI